MKPDSTLLAGTCATICTVLRQQRISLPSHLGETESRTSPSIIISTMIEAKVTYVANINLVNFFVFGFVIRVCKNTSIKEGKKPKITICLFASNRTAATCIKSSG